jgi:diguanylate cyclase (GGDEF)-like protein
MNVNTTERESRENKIFILITSLIIIICLIFFDRAVVKAIGHDMPFIFFYLIPVGMTSWYIGRKTGICISILSGAALFATGYKIGIDHTMIFFYVWSGAAGVIFCSAFAVILSALRREIRTERQFAMEDFLTKASNSRAFYNYAAIEINRIKRYNKPLTIAYLDIDNFKKINDAKGHLEGDKLLMVTAAFLRANIRATDAVARLGGDEFAILLPEMPPEPAIPFMEHLLRILRVEIGKYKWPVTFSTGVVTFMNPPLSVHYMLKAADALMYEVKKSGKNNIKYKVQHL